MQCSRYGINSVKVTAIVLVMLCPDIPAAIEVDGGADVRQNALLMSSPLEMDTALSPEGSFGISETRLRFRSSAYYGGFVLNCALESRAGFISSDSGMLSLSEGGGSIFGKSRPLEHWDLTWEHIEEQSTSLSSRIERLDVRWKAWNVDFDIGRQPVSLGTSHFIGVLDVLAPFAPGDLDATYKPGIDAVRIRKGLGMTGEAEIIAAGAKNFSDGAVLGRYRTMVQGIDF